VQLSYRLLDKSRSNTRTISLRSAAAEDMRRLSIVNNNTQDISLSNRYTTIASNSTRDDIEATVLVRFLKIQDYLGLYTRTNYNGTTALYTGAWPSDALPLVVPSQRRDVEQDFKTREFTVLRTPR